MVAVLQMLKVAAHAAGVSRGVACQAAMRSQSRWCGVNQDHRVVGGASPERTRGWVEHSTDALAIPCLTVFRIAPLRLIFAVCERRSTRAYFINSVSG
jgi:hypothetical protein